MNRTLAIVLLLAACDGSPSIESDAGCNAPGTAADQPVIACPDEVDLGCLPEGGAAIDFEVTTASCDGSEVTVVCTPSDGSIVTAGTTMGRCTATAPSGATAECTFPIRSRISGAPQIVCPAPSTSACSAPSTAIELESPTVMASCDGGDVGTPTNDAPVGGFPVGTTRVTWTASVTGGAPLTCTTDVTIEDNAAPAIACVDPEGPLVRTSSADPIAIDPPSATDACDDSLDVVLSGVPESSGVHTVVASSTDDAGNAGECSFDVEIIDAFAPTDLRIVSAALAPDGTTDVTLGWEPSPSADVSSIRLERASAPDGPWSELSTLPIATITYTDAAMPASGAYYRLVAMAGALEGGATDPVRAFAIADDEYHLREQTVTSVPFATSLFGVVRHPSDLGAGPFPLVLFLHGNHGNCRPTGGGEDECGNIEGYECTDPGYGTTPNAHGYTYLQDTLAARGYISASLSANALNCRNDYIPQRTQLILEHLRRWVAWNAAGGSAPFGTTFSGAVDLSRVALVGHSRGGEAVSSVPEALADTPIAGVTISSVFAIGPTDFHGPAPTGSAFAVLLPGCDADVRTLEGLRHYDRGLDPPDPHARAQVLYVGANHNFFNTEWRYDDNDTLFRVCGAGTLVGGAAQRGMLEIALADWIESSARGERYPAYQRADAQTPPILDAWADAALDLRWSYSAASRAVVDNFAGEGAPDVNGLGGSNTYAGQIASIECADSCASNYPHLTNGIRLAWDMVESTAIFSLDGFDASAWDALSMRFASRLASINDEVVTHDFLIRVRDGAGNTAELPLSSVSRFAHGYSSFQEMEMLSTVRVPFTALLAVRPTLEVGNLETIELAMPIASNPAGSIWLADVDFAGD
jgi:hypothetical protein